MLYALSNADKSINWEATGNDRIAQNVLNLIRTKKYEVPFLPEMGLEPENIDGVVQKLKYTIENDVMELIETWENRAVVLSVDINEVTEDGNVVFTVELEV